MALESHETLKDLSKQSENRVYTASAKNLVVSAPGGSLCFESFTRRLATAEKLGVVHTLTNALSLKCVLNFVWTLFIVRIKLNVIFRGQAN